MQRRARTYFAGVALAATLSGGLTACSGSSGDDDGQDTKAGGSTAASPAAPPGKYRTLPEPCGALGHDTLKDLLPGAEAAEDGGSGAAAGGGSGDGASASPYDGEATVTYDTDRHVGCRWKSATSLATRHLSVDFERVVSYDPAVSDDKQAELLYDEQAGQADIPTDSTASPDDKSAGNDDDESGKKDKDDDAGKTGTDGTGRSAGGDKGKKGDDDASGSEKSDSGSPSPGPSDSSLSPKADLSPRMLGDIGDNAYIDDQLDTGDSGVHRDITLVFRSANVVATVKYDQWLTDKRRVPDSAELQEKARSVAAELAAGFDDN